MNMSELGIFLAGMAFCLFLIAPFLVGNRR